MKFLCAALVLVFSFSTVLADELPNRQRRMSIFHLEKSPEGVKLLSRFENRDRLFDIYRYDAIVSNNPLKLYEIINTEDGTELRLNAELLASSSLYMSWVLAISLVGYEKFLIEKKYSVELPHFLEMSYWSHSRAMKHWQQMDYPNDHDYAKHPDDHIAEVARRLQASTTELTRFHKVSRESFLDKLKSRHISLGYENLGIDDFIQRASGSEKAAARELKSLMKY